MAQVRGLTIGASGKFSDTAFKLIGGLAHEGALKNPGPKKKNKKTSALTILSFPLISTIAMPRRQTTT